MENSIRFVSTTQEQYDSIQNKSWGYIYFIDDTKRVYKGDTMFASELAPVYDNKGNFMGYSLAGQSDKLIAQSTGIRKNQLSDDVQTSLDHAESAYTAVEALAQKVDAANAILEEIA